MNPSFRRSRARRGILLLLVLSALTFFMMLGALMLTLATRSRAAARAFANAAGMTAADSLQSRMLLDEALLVLLRGSKNTLPAQITDSLLADRYGTSTTGFAVAGSVVPYAFGSLLKAGPLLVAQLENLTPAVTHPCDLNGRVLTLKPDLDDGETTSFRILRATGAAAPFTVYLARTSNRSLRLPKKRCAVVVNGNEFLTEAHDSSDTDTWLARVELENSLVKTVSRGSYAPDGASMECDNDNDGVADGVWIAGTTGFFPDRPSPNGGLLRYRVSYHVLDLDGRANLNAHGSLVAATSGTGDWLSTAQGVGISGVTPGLGYGAADVDVSRLLGSDDTPGVPWNQSRRLTNLLRSNTAGAPAVTQSSDQRRVIPALGTPIEGRYGPAVSGTVSAGATGAKQSETAQAGLTGNSPTDLNASVRAFLKPPGAGVPTLTFYLPDRTKSDFEQDPYQLRLDDDGPRGATIRQPAAKAATPPADNPFTLGELERILRQYDADAAALPPRLAAALDDYAQRSRMTVSTDTWDTPAMAGSALQNVRAYMRQFPTPTSPFSDAFVYGAMSPDVTAGLRFDLNRPLNHPKVPASNEWNLKQRYIRHLFTLLCALDSAHASCTVAEKAQFATNVCDFRDKDSTMTIFRYDTNPLDGWMTSTTSPVVVGVERPEVVITEMISWTGHVQAVLHHPWNALITDKTGTTSVTETVDPNLQGSGTNTVALAKSAAGSPVWRMRCVGGGTTTFAGSSELAVNDSICVQTADPPVLPAPAPSLVTTLSKKCSDAAFVPGTSGGKLILERLADPTRAADTSDTSANYNPYVTVDEATLTVYTDQASAQTSERSDTNGFWKTTFTTVTKRAPAAYPKVAPWLHWPNRPFVSAGELALVPTGNARDLLANYDQQRGSPSLVATAPGMGILDAVYVPSRFVGTSQALGLTLQASGTGTFPLLLTSATTEQVCTTQLPRWREPGRVNVNTIARNTGNSASHLDDGVWRALVGDAAPSNPFNSGATGQAATSFAKLVSMDSSVSSQPPGLDSPAAPRQGNPFFNHAAAIRLANVGTIRSHVFAVWITLETEDTTDGSKTWRRMFAIVDRSLPVGYSPGENLNVRDTVRLQRFLE